MAGIPPAHGGDRAFIEDPARATNAEAISDLSAQFQAMLHVMSLVPELPAEARAIVDAVRPRTNVTREAAETLSRRDIVKRNPDPLTAIPAEGFGAQPFGNTRTTNITKFDGKSGDNTVFVWLSSCSVVARASQLNPEAIFQLLLMTSGGSVFSYLETCMRKGMTLFHTIQALEKRYGELCTPDEAKMRINSYVRSPHVKIDKVYDDLTHLARIATREEAAAVREDRSDELVRHNLLRVLPGIIGSRMTDELTQASALGGHLLSNDEIVARAKLLEEKSSGHVHEDKPRKERSDRRHDRGHDRDHVHQVVYDPPASSRYSSEDVDEILAVCEATDQDSDLLDEINAVGEVFATQNVKVSRNALLSAAIKQYNKKRGTRPTRIAEVNQQAQSGPPNKLGAARLSIDDLLKMANVVRGECLHCGLGGHIRGNIRCQLRDLDPVDRPCTRCGKGLHSADQCPKGKSTLVNQVTEDESLNEA